MTRIQRILASLLVSGLCASGVSAASVAGIANLPFYDIDHRMLQPSGGLSADGRALVVGEYGPGYSRSVVLRQDLQNPTPLVDGQSGLALIQTYGISGDGSVVVGVVGPESPNDWSEGAIWRAPEEVIRTGYLAGTGEYGRYSWMAAASETGDVVVGGATGAPGSGFIVATIWTQATGLLPLPIDASSVNPNNESRESEALGVSADGQTVVGAYGGWAFVWNLVTGTTFLGDGFGSNRDASRATAVSADGSKVVGIAKIDGVDQPYAWTESAGLVGLSNPESTEGSNGWALAVSADGGVIVGDYQPYDVGYPEERAFIWSEENGMRDLQEFLESLHINTADWYYLKRAWAVSADGATIVGTGRRKSNSEEETFVAQIEERSTGVGLCTLGDPGCVPVDLVAISDGLIPGAVGWQADRYVGFLKPVINALGDVGFNAFLTYRWAIFGPDEARQLAVRARDGDPAPGAPGTNPGIRIDHNSDPVMNDAGDIAFLAHVGEAGSQAYGPMGLWRSRVSTNGLELVALEDEPVPSDPSSTYSTIGERHSIDAQGGVGFLGQIAPCDGMGWCAAVWRPGDSAFPELVLSGADPISAASPDDRLLHSWSQSTSASGQAAFQTLLTGPGVDESNDSALWATDSAGDLVMVMREGGPVPGHPAGTTFVLSSHGMGEQHSQNDLGHVAFRAQLNGPGISPQNADGIWLWKPDAQLELVLREGDAAPTEVAGAVFDLLHEPIMNQAGDIAFLGHTTGVAGFAYWRRSADGVLTELLRSGESAPGLSLGITLREPFSDDFYPNEFRTIDPVLSDSGSALLDFWLVGTGVDATNDRALYLVDALGSPTLVVRKGDPIEISAGEVRTVSDYYIWNGFLSTLGRKPINERDEVVALLHFTDGSEAVARFNVPEPGLAIGLAAGCLLIGWFARQPRTPSSRRDRCAARPESGARRPCS